jgi:hypothetical protein
VRKIIDPFWTPETDDLEAKMKQTQEEEKQSHAAKL